MICKGVESECCVLDLRCLAQSQSPPNPASPAQSQTSSHQKDISEEGPPASTSGSRTQNAQNKIIFTNLQLNGDIVDVPSANHGSANSDGVPQAREKLHVCHAPKSFGTALLEVLLLGLDVATPGKLPRRAGRVELMPTMRRSSPLLL